MNLLKLAYFFQYLADLLDIYAESTSFEEYSPQELDMITSASYECRFLSEKMKTIYNRWHD